MSYSSTILADTPAAYWRMGDTNTTLADSSGNSHAGSYTGTNATDYTRGVTGLISGDADTAVNFLGTNGGCAQATFGISVGTGDFSVESWVEWTGSGTQVIWSAASLWLGVASGVCTVSGCTGGALTHQTAMSTGTTYHIVLTRHAGVCTLSLNAVPCSSTQTDTSSLTGSITQTIAGLGSASFEFAGVIDEVAFYETTNYLTSAKVSAHYAAGTAAAAATTFTAPASPTTITVGGTTSVTITPDNPYTGTITGTPSGSASTGLSAVTKTFSASNTPQVASWTPTVAGTLTIALTNNGGLTNPADDTVTVNAGPQTIAVTDSNLVFSGGNWDCDGAGAYQDNHVKAGSTYALSNNPGAELTFAVTSAGSGSIKLNLDTSVSSGLGTSDYPRICYNTNDSALSDQQILTSGGSQVTIQSSLPAGTYQVRVWFEGVSISGVGDRYTDLTTDASAVKITGVEIDADSVMAAPTILGGIAVFYGDSITEGCDAVGGANGPGDQDATQTFARYLAASVGCEAGIIGFAGQGYTATGSGNVPVFSSSYDHYSSGRSRLAGGVLPFSPDYVFVCMGTNDSSGIASAVSTMLGNLRTIAPDAKLVQVVPFGQNNASDITSGFNTYHAGDSNSYLIDAGTDYTAGGTPVAHGGGRYWTTDGIHPNVRGHAAWGTALAQKLQEAVGGSGGGAGILPNSMNGGLL